MVRYVKLREFSDLLWASWLDFVVTKSFYAAFAHDHLFLYFSYLSTSAVTTNPSEGAVPTTSTTNNSGYWVGIGWVEFDQNFGKSTSEQRSEDPTSPPPKYEELWPCNAILCKVHTYRHTTQWYKCYTQQCISKLHLLNNTTYLWYMSH